MVLLLCVYNIYTTYVYSHIQHMYTHLFCSGFFPELIVVTVQYIHYISLHYRDVGRGGGPCALAGSGDPLISPGVHIIPPPWSNPPLTNHCWWYRQVCTTAVLCATWLSNFPSYGFHFLFLRFIMKVELFMFFLVISEYSYGIKAQVI